MRSSILYLQISAIYVLSVSEKNVYNYITDGRLFNEKACDFIFGI